MGTIYFLLVLSLALLARYIDFYRDIFFFGQFNEYTDLQISVAVFSVPIAITAVTYIFSSLYMVRTHLAYHALRRARWIGFLMYCLCFALFVSLFVVEDTRIQIFINSCVIFIGASVTAVSILFNDRSFKSSVMLSISMFLIALVFANELYYIFYGATLIIDPTNSSTYHVLFDVLFLIFGFYFLRYSYAESKEFVEISRLDNKNIVKDIFEGIEYKQFFLEYQPQVNIKDNTIYGLESLVRWRHPEKGLVEPKDFIPIAEKLNIVTLITEQVLEQAISDAKKLFDDGNPQVVSVNFSVRDLTHPMYVYLFKLLQKYELPAEYICIEITEHSMIKDSSRVINILRKMQALGVKTSLDDYGTGFSSMKYLHILPIHHIKIDYSFVKDIANKVSCVIVNSTIELAQNLNKTSIAEGVETAEQLQLLKEMNCDIVQGFYFAKPMSIEKYIEWEQGFKQNN